MIKSLNFIPITMGRHLREGGRKGRRENRREGRTDRERGQRKKESERGRMEGREGLVTLTQTSPLSAIVAKVRMSKSYKTREACNSICFLLSIN